MRICARIVSTIYMYILYMVPKKKVCAIIDLTNRCIIKFPKSFADIGECAHARIKFQA